MKRIRVLLLLCAIAVVGSMAVLPLAAKATGGGGSTSGTSVSIRSTADFDFAGTNVDVGLIIRCSGGSGTVVVQLEQYPPETPFPVGEGSGPNLVACDGKAHTTAVTVVGAVFDPGKAKATATVVAPSGNKTVTSWVTIVQ